MSKNSHLAPLRMTFGCFLLPAFTCKKRRDRLLTLLSPVLEIRGWIPRGCWCSLALRFEDLYYVALSSLLPSGSGKQNPLLPISLCVIEYLSCIWFVGRDSWDVAAPTATPTPEACNSTPCNRSLKMWLSSSASGTWLINYKLASTVKSLSQTLHITSQMYPNCAAVVLYGFIWVNMKCRYCP